MKKKIFRATRLVPAPKVHRESKGNKKIFALRALCSRLRFTGKAMKKKMFCATRLVPAPKVHRQSKDKQKFFALRA